MDLICSACGTRGRAKRITRGSLVIEIILWLCFIIPGFIYSIWRMTTRTKGCRACGSTALVPVTSPVGKELLAKYASVMVLFMSLSACSLTPSERAEVTWQILNGIDMLQTDHLARSPECFEEANQLTAAIVGDHPERAEAAAVGIVYAAGYRFVSRWLDRKVEAEASKRWLRTAWHALGITAKVAIVAENHREGLRVGSTGCGTPRASIIGPTLPIM